MLNFISKPPSSSAEWESYYDLRWRVLRHPLKMPKQSAHDELDKIARHAAVFVNEKAVACGRIHTKEPEVAQVRFMAVDPDYQKQGLGRKILEQLEQIAKGLAYKSLFLNARETAIPFYEKAGYRITGRGPFVLDIQHQTMEKIISPE